MPLVDVETLNQPDNVLLGPVGTCNALPWMKQVLATNGDTHLGGEDFDQRVMQYFIKLFNRKTGIDITGDNKATQKLRREVGSFTCAMTGFDQRPLVLTSD